MKHIKNWALSAVLLLITGNAWAVKLRDYTPYNFEVLFTNPICKTYRYDEPQVSRSGYEILSKPKNAYCKSSDSSKNQWRDDSPHKRLVDWIKDRKTKEIFLAYLSFSKGSIQKELCNAIRYRNVKVTLIIDSHNLPSYNDGSNSRMATANALKRCRPKSSFENPNYPTVVTRGSRGQGRNKTGFAHNKVFFVNPFNDGEVKIAFSSGNMSSGTVTHHENWSFVTTSSESFFAQMHLCLMEGMLEHDNGISAYRNFVRSCRSQIEVQEESDIKVFFVPGDGEKATSAISKAIYRARSVDVVSHRISYGSLLNMLRNKLNRGGDVRFIGDDDLYWASVYRRGMGRNTLGEWNKVRGLISKGAEAKFIETYADDVFNPKSMQLQHNKFLVFHQSNGRGSVFTGAGNLTSSAFTRNFENFYMISIPEVYQVFKNQYQYMWDELATDEEDMPEELVLP